MFPILMEETEQFIEAMFGKIVENKQKCSKLTRYHEPDIVWEFNSIKAP
jgi:hypothetical protein